MQLPIGVSNFRKLIEYKSPISNEGYSFVDKSLLIRELLDDLTEVIVFTRPRRFGKTLNLSMLQHFFAAEVTGQPTKGLFASLKIAKDAICMQQQGQYPVIFISFKDIKQPNFKFCIEKIGSIIAATYRKHEKELNSDKMSENDKSYIKSILEQTISHVNLESSIHRLLELLFKYYNTKPILLIDEYDTPIQEAYLRGYYEELIPFFRNFLSEPLKDDNLLKRAVLTGILRVSKESLFSGLSSVEIYSILHKKYADYFGFTENETNELLNKAKLSVINEAKEWYNGYNFAGTTIYNPLSIVKFIKEEGKIGPYWINTSGNELIRQLLTTSEIETQDKFGQLIAGGTIKEVVDEHIVFQDLKENRAAIWGLFFMSGYLKVLSLEFGEYGNICELAIPNKEVEFLYKQIFREWLSGNRGIIWYQELLASLIAGKTEEFERKLQKAIIEMASYHDTSKTTQEVFYQGLMLGILSGLKDNYEIRSNRESGYGRYDLLIIPKDPNKLGIVMEFKAVDNELKLADAANEALLQIKTSEYITELTARGINNVCLMGIGFSGKAIKIISE